MNTMTQTSHRLRSKKYMVVPAAPTSNSMGAGAVFGVDSAFYLPTHLTERR